MAPTTTLDGGDLAARTARLSLEQKVRLLSGADFWSLHPEPAAGLRRLVVSDGPAGVRVDVLVAPTVNLHRTPYGGRQTTRGSSSATAPTTATAGRPVPVRPRTRLYNVGMCVDRDVRLGDRGGRRGGGGSPPQHRVAPGEDRRPALRAARAGEGRAPVRWLAGFATVEAEPGEDVAATVTVARRAFEHWDEAAGGWAVEPGISRLVAGLSSARQLVSTEVMVRAD